MPEYMQLSFIKDWDFETRGEEYISPKTGMPIIKMVQEFNY